MFEHITLDIILLLMLYAVGATVSAMACVYLLLIFCCAGATPLRGAYLRPNDCAGGRLRSSES